MEQVILYIIRSVLVSGVLTAYYLVALRNRKLHDYNRFYLLTVLVVSLVLPLVRINWSPFSGLGGSELGRLGGFAGHAGSGGGTAGAPAAGRVLAGFGFFAGGVSLVLLVVWMSRVLQVYRLKSRQSVSRMGGYDLIETDDPRAPFSFLNNLFWRRGADPHEPVNKKMLDHELAHIVGRHSWDGLFAQLLACLFWMNPFFWVIRRELSVVHEFIADAATGMEGDGEGFARMLLQSMNEGRFLAVHEGQLLAPVHGFFQSPIKRRLMMMCNNKRSGLSLVRKALVLPVLVTLTILVSCSKVQAPDALDATDMAKLNKEKLDMKVRRLVLSGVLRDVKLKIAFSDSGNAHPEQKRQIELQLNKLENVVFDTPAPNKPADGSK
jgi:hypothetical protein